MKVADATREGDNPRKNESSIVYCIPCGGCPRKYFGESNRGLFARIKEHRADVKFHRTSNSLVQHIDTHNHLPDWQKANVIHKGINKSIRKALERMHIELELTTNSRPGFISWTNTTATIARKDWQLKDSGRGRRKMLSDPT